eukprot:5046672-Lingulodinium_polyedra.AAC.1
MDAARHAVRQEARAFTRARACCAAFDRTSADRSACAYSGSPCLQPAARRECLTSARARAQSRARAYTRALLNGMRA